MKSQKFVIIPITSGVTPKHPALTINGDQITAEQAHAIAQAVAEVPGKPVSLFAPGRRTPAGLYAPKP